MSAPCLFSGPKQSTHENRKARVPIRKKTAASAAHLAQPHCPDEGFNSELCAAEMSDKIFRNMSEFIQGACGIKLPPHKKTMLEGRLRKRMRVLNIGSFEEYCEHLFSPKSYDLELIHMIDVVTTNKTDFFREPDHFDYLLNTVLPELVGMQGFSVRKKLGVWSAGCSTGEEPYTLAMVLSEFSEQCPGFEFSILATDISTAVLEKAGEGIYREDEVCPIPMGLRKKYLLRCKNREKKLVRMAPELRSLVKFRRINFVQEDYGIREDIKVIFCRNVLIYFDRPTQEKILTRLSEHLSTGGYLFTGHSESLHGMELPLMQTTTTVYKRL